MSLFHQITKLSCNPSHKSFLEGLQNPLKAQKCVLERMGLQEKPSSQPQKYLDIEKEVLKGLEKSEGRFYSSKMHFEPTSGSTNEVKWIPYNLKFKKELDRAAGPWLFDLYSQFPGISQGKHYWSLSWLPDDLRTRSQIDDSDALPWYKSYLLKKLMITDKSLQKLPSSRLFLLESLARMIESPVSLISVWSPTYLLKILDLLLTEREWLEKRLAGNLRLLNILKRTSSLEENLLRELFPYLKLISAWDSGASSLWATKVKNLFPWVTFQGKGLWATEGVVTIPFQGSFPLAINSHYYEFLCPESGKILSLNELQKDQVIQPLLTTGSGFVRYLLEDNLLVKDFLHQTPCFEFLGRSRHMDIAGEKLSYEVAENIMNTLKQEFSIDPVCFVAKGSKTGGGYELLVSSESLEKDLTPRLIQRGEELLLKHHHYKLARDLGQLCSMKIRPSDNPLEDYYEVCKKRVTIDGNIKAEPIIFEGI